MKNSTLNAIINVSFVLSLIFNILSILSFFGITNSDNPIILFYIGVIFLIILTISSWVLIKKEVS